MIILVSNATIMVMHRVGIEFIGLGVQIHGKV